jgi:hypothetical protein
MSPKPKPCAGQDALYALHMHVYEVARDVWNDAKVGAAAATIMSNAAAEFTRQLDLFRAAQRKHEKETRPCRRSQYTTPTAKRLTTPTTSSEAKSLTAGS